MLSQLTVCERVRVIDGRAQSRQGRNSKTELGSSKCQQSNNMSGAERFTASDTHFIYKITLRVDPGQLEDHSFFFFSFPCGGSEISYRPHAMSVTSLGRTPRPRGANTSQQRFGDLKVATCERMHFSIQVPVS